MFNHLHYVPILKWKLGEYQALTKLSAAVKERITPLLEIPSIGYDFENSRNSKSLDDHLKDFGKRLKSKWQNRRCFVDLKYIGASDRLADGTHPLQHVLTLAHNEGCVVTPVIALTSDAAYLQCVAVDDVAWGNGAALRLRLEDFDRANLASAINDALSAAGVSIADTDLIVDLEDKQFLPVTAFVTTLTTALGLLPSLNLWRSFTIAGTSYPPTLAGITGSTMVLRREWEVYQAFVGTLGAEARIPTFGDYAVAHPDPVELDMRLIKPFAKLRYTTSQHWYIAKGTAVRTNGFDQYRAMCAAVTTQPFYDGPAFSESDRYIAACAAGTETTGNLTTWVWVSTNRHVTRVVFDVANFHGASAPPL
ncbi:beta family protein [Phyllobacterium ifriqiyense]|uniref:beta family protein n=1 Tax=Phyllobacterium ifriqiyense TaxID=314238 RepID=UPI00339622B4